MHRFFTALNGAYLTIGIKVILYLLQFRAKCGIIYLCIYNVSLDRVISH